MSMLTNEQSQFLDAEGKIVLCACPGSGKTFVVGKKVVKYLENWAYDYRGMAVLSFTNVASEEIIKQVNEISKVNFSNFGFPHYIGTLDSFIDNYIFLRFGYLMYGQNRKRPKIIHDNIGSLPYAKKECYDKGCTRNTDIFHWGEGGLLKNGHPIDCNVTQKPCQKFKKSMFKNGYVTQREVATFSLRILKRFPNIAQEIAYRFPVIIIDEAQDTSKEQMEIIELIANSGTTTVAIVGDPDQAIYEWRDATPEYFTAKLNDDNWQHLYLTANFRSSQHICNATSKFSSVLENKKAPQAMGDYCQYPKKPILLQVSSQKKKEDIIEWFKAECLENGIDPAVDRVSVLTRGKIHNGTDIPDLWQTAETELLAYSTYLWNCSSKKDAFLKCEKALYGIMIGDSRGLSLEGMHESIEKVCDYSEWKKTVILLLSLLPKADTSIKEWKKVITNTLEDLIQKSIINIAGNRKLTDIIKTKSRIKIGEFYSTEFLNLQLFKFFEKKTTEEIIYSSVHGVKGETFDATLLVVDNVRGNTVTPSLLTRGDLNNELMRIAYVAMTRPRKLLVVSIPKQKSSVALNRFPFELWDYKEL